MKKVNVLIAAGSWPCLQPLHCAVLKTEDPEPPRQKPRQQKGHQAIV